MKPTLKNDKYGGESGRDFVISHASSTAFVSSLSQRFRPPDFLSSPPLLPLTGCRAVLCRGWCLDSLAAGAGVVSASVISGFRV